MVAINNQLYTVDIRNGAIEIIEVSKDYNVNRNAILIQNTGDTTARLNGGWTFKPGAVLALGGQHDMARYNDTLCIEFLNDGEIRRIEIWPLVTTLCPVETHKIAC